MKKKRTRINIEDVPDDLSGLNDDIEIVVNDRDFLQEDEFWDNIRDFGGPKKESIDTIRAQDA